MKARRLLVAASIVVSLSIGVPSAFAGNPSDPWTVSPDSCTTSLLDATVAGVDAALTVL